MKYVAIPNIFRVTLSQDIATKCNLNCSYCIAKQDKHTAFDTSTEKAKEILKVFDTDIVLTGTGEPLLEYDKIVDLLEFIKENNLRTTVKIMTNGQEVEKIKYLLDHYSNVEFMRSMTLSNDKDHHNNRNVLYHKRVVNKLLVDVDDDFSSYDYQLQRDNNFILKSLTLPGISKRFKGSFLEKYLKENQNILEKILPSSLYKYGYGIACVGNNLFLKPQCNPIGYEDYHDPNNILKGVMLYKDAMYNYMRDNISKCCCMNKEDNLEEQMLELHKDKDYNKKIAAKTEELYEKVFAEPDEGEEEIKVAVELSNLEHNYSLESDAYEMYKRIFNTDQEFKCFALEEVAYMQYLEKYEKDCYIMVFVPTKYRNFMVVTGEAKEILKLFRNPLHYKIYGSIFNKLFRVLIKDIIR